MTNKRNGKCITDLKWLGLSILMLVATSVCVYLMFSSYDEKQVLETFPNHAPLYIGEDGIRAKTPKKDVRP